ncbi:centrosomal protein of 95 kDa-like isoform X2 [Ptychodera flava]|uniref:centrosomal protein of 95 kDa-like isoform X2 n=1 Tax=Ptychodera flava TaxID=63121 RepID=UPI00396AB0B4
MDNIQSTSLDDEEEQGFVALANELLTKFNLPEINSLAEFLPANYIALYEGILGDTLPGLIQNPITREDEIHNTQKVIDSLGLHILRTDLSHITGEAIVDGDFVAIRNLIEIFAGLLEYVMEAISSEGGSTDADVDAISDDPDILTSGALSTISDVLKEELGTSYSYDYSTKPDMQQRETDSETKPGDSTADLIKLGEVDDAVRRDLSPAKSDSTSGSSRYYADTSYMSNGVYGRFQTAPRSPVAETTQDLIRESEDWMAKLKDYRERWGYEQREPYSPGKTSTTVTDQSTTSSPLIHKSKLKEPYSPARSYIPSSIDSAGSSPLADRGVMPEADSTKASPMTKTTQLSSVVSSPSKSVTFSDAPPQINEDDSRLSTDKDTTGASSSSVSRTPGARRRIDTSFESSKTRKFAWGDADKNASPAKPVKPVKTATPTRMTASPRKHVQRYTETRYKEDRLRDREPRQMQRYTPRSKQRGRSPLGGSRFPSGSRSPSSGGSPVSGRSPMRVKSPAQSKSPRKQVIQKEKVSREFIDPDQAKEDVTNLRHHRDALRQRVERDVDRMMEQEADVSYHSDSEVDYGKVWNMLKEARERPHQHNGIIESESEDDLDIRPKYGRSPPRRPQQTNFEAALDADAKGPMANLRKQLSREDKQRQMKTEVMKHLYESHLNDVKAAQKKTLSEKKRKVKKIDQIYKTVNKKPMTSSKYKPQSKYSVSVQKPSLSKPASAPTTPVAKRRRKNQPISPGRGIGPKRPLTVHEDDLLPTMLEEFPFLHVSPQTAHDMWSKQMRQIELLAKADEHHQRKTKTQKKLEEAESRQRILMNIMRKELAHNQRMRDIRDRDSQQQLVKTRVRENRQASARARRYYEEFQQRMRAKMLKRRTKEEQIFKRLFEDGLEIQKSRIKELRSYAREKREALAKRQQNEIDSLENYYRDQFNMLAETIARERYELQVRDSAQAKVMEQMKKELRQKMEQEIKDLQENMHRDEDSAYFRQLEADRLRKELQIASYKTDFEY